MARNQISASCVPDTFLSAKEQENTGLEHGRLTRERPLLPCQTKNVLRPRAAILVAASAVRLGVQYTCSRSRYSERQRSAKAHQGSGGRHASRARTQARAARLARRRGAERATREMRSHCVDRRRCRCEGLSECPTRERVKVRASALQVGTPSVPVSTCPPGTGPAGSLCRPSRTRRSIILDVAAATPGVAPPQDDRSAPRVTTVRFETCAPVCSVHRALSGSRRRGSVANGEWTSEGQRIFFLNYCDVSYRYISATRDLEIDPPQRATSVGMANVLSSIKCIHPTLLITE